MSDVEGLNAGDITFRINHQGWSVEEAITRPKKKRNQLFEYNGKRQTISQWAKEYGFTWEQLRDRIDKLGWSFEKAITTPIHSKHSH